MKADRWKLQFNKLVVEALRDLVSTETGDLPLPAIRRAFMETPRWVRTMPQINRAQDILLFSGCLVLR